MELVGAHSRTATTRVGCWLAAPAAAAATSHTNLCRSRLRLGTRRACSSRARRSCRYTTATGRWAAAATSTPTPEAACTIRCRSDRRIDCRLRLRLRLLAGSRRWRGRRAGVVSAPHDFSTQGRVLAFLFINRLVPPAATTLPSPTIALALAPAVAFLPITLRYPHLLLRHRGRAPEDVAVVRERHARHLAGRSLVQRHRLAILDVTHNQSRAENVSTCALRTSQPGRRVQKAYVHALVSAPLALFNLVLHAVVLCQAVHHEPVVAAHRREGEPLSPAPAGARPRPFRARR